MNNNSNNFPQPPQGLPANIMVSTEERNQFVRFIISAIQRVKGSNFDIERTKRLAQEFEKQALAKSSTKQQYIDHFKSKIADINQMKQRQDQMVAAVAARANANANNNQPPNATNQQQGQLNQQHQRIMPQQSQQQQPQPPQPQPQSQPQGQPQPQMNPQQHQQQQAANMQRSSNWHNLPIPDTLLNRLPPLFPKEYNTWATILPYFKNKTLSEQDMSSIKNTLGLHQQLVKTAQMQEMRKSMQKQQQEQSVAQAKQKLQQQHQAQPQQQNNNMNQLGMQPNVGTLNPEQILMMQRQAQSQTALRRESPSMLHAQPNLNQQQPQPPQPSIAQKPLGGAPNATGNRPQVPISQQQLQIFKSQALASIRKLQAQGRIKSPMTPEEENIWVRRYLVQMGKQQQQQRNAALAAAAAQANNRQSSQPPQQQRPPKQVSPALTTQQLAAFQREQQKKRQIQPSPSLNSAQLKILQQQQAAAQAVQAVQAQRNVQASGGPPMFNGQVPPIFNSQVPPGPGPQQQQQPPPAQKSQPTPQQQHAVPQQLPTNQNQRQTQNRQSFPQNQQPANVLQPQLGVSGLKLFQGVHATESDWNNLKKIYQAVASSPINLRDFTDQISEQEKTRILKFAKANQQLVMACEAIIIPNFYIMTKNADATTRLMYSHLMFKQIIEKLKSNGKYFASAELLEKIQAQITRYLSYVRENAAKLAKASQLQTQQQRPQQVPPQGRFLPQQGIPRPGAPQQPQQPQQLPQQRFAPPQHPINPASVSQQFRQLADQRQGTPNQQPIPIQAQQQHQLPPQQQKIPPQFVPPNVSTPTSVPLTPSAGSTSPSNAKKTNNRRRKTATPRAKPTPPAVQHHIQTPAAPTTTAAPSLSMSPEAQMMMKENNEAIAKEESRLRVVDEQRNKRRELAQEDPSKYFLATLADTLNLPTEEAKVFEMGSSSPSKINSTSSQKQNILQPPPSNTQSTNNKVLTPSAILTTPLPFNVKTPPSSRMNAGTPSNAILHQSQNPANSKTNSIASKFDNWAGKIKPQIISDSFKNVGVPILPSESINLEKITHDFGYVLSSSGGNGAPGINGYSGVSAPSLGVSGGRFWGGIYPTPPDDLAELNVMSKKRTREDDGINASDKKIKLEGESVMLGAPEVKAVDELDKFWNFDSW